MRSNRQCVQNFSPYMVKKSHKPLSIKDKNSKPVQEQLKAFYWSLIDTLGDRAAGQLVKAGVGNTPEYEPYVDDAMTEPIVLKMQTTCFAASHALHRVACTTQSEPV
jgi:hypothetical protein